MSLFAISDLHLSLSSDKPMDKFGGWENYMSRLEENWRNAVAADDTVVIPGDVSWAMDFAAAKADFAFLDSLPGTKIVGKGNHDYWWSSLNKINTFLSDNNFNSIKILHNNHYAYGDYGICGTRGWINEKGEPADAKILTRETFRLERSIKSAVSAGLTPLVFIHYPPIYIGELNIDILQVMKSYNIERCYYGHLHGEHSHKKAILGKIDGYSMIFELISSDYLLFKPKKVVF